MTTIGDKLTDLGILRGADVIATAREASLELTLACVLLDKESAGGKNVWGHDNVETGGAYEKGGPVTKQNYYRYKTARQAKRAGPQGCGPCQLTWPPLQERADKMGGCWDPVVNMRVGFQQLADLIGHNGIRDGFRRYNGSGHAADVYADHAMVRLRVWRSRLGVVDPLIPPASTPAWTGAAGLPTLRKGDSGPAVAHLQDFGRRVFPLYADDAMIGGRFGDITERFVIKFQENSGLRGDGVVGPVTNKALWAAGYRG